jgi:hypothetical protein
MSNSPPEISLIMYDSSIKGIRALNLPPLIVPLSKLVLLVLLTLRPRPNLFYLSIWLEGFGGDLFFEGYFQIYLSKFINCLNLLTGGVQLGHTNISGLCEAFY